MKRFLTVVMLLTGITGFANTTPDTTVTSFEIHLKRKSNDSSLGFTTTSIDRLKLYNTVMQEIKSKISAKEFSSLHKPLVLLKFQEYLNEKPHADEISFIEEQSLKGHKYNYFVKIYGQLNTKSSFTLRVCVFDANGRLIAKGKSRSSCKSLLTAPSQEKDDSSKITEQQFVELVTGAASELNLSI